MADQLQDGLDLVNDVLGDLEALGALSDLSLGNPVEPMQNQIGAIAAVGEAAVGAGTVLKNLLEGS